MKLHRHDWEVRAVEAGQQKFVMYDGARIPQGTVTVALYVCAGCGKTESTNIAGTWTVEDLKGSRP